MFCSVIWVRPRTKFRKECHPSFFHKLQFWPHHLEIIINHQYFETEVGALDHRVNEYMLNRWQTTVRAYVVVSEFALLAGCKVYSEIPKNNTIKIWNNTTRLQRTKSKLSTSRGTKLMVLWNVNQWQRGTLGKNFPIRCPHDFVDRTIFIRSGSPTTLATRQSTKKQMNFSKNKQKLWFSWSVWHLPLKVTKIFVSPQCKELEKKGIEDFQPQP